MPHPSNRIFKDYKKLSQLANSGTVFVAFDTETTGLRASNDRIIEIGAVKFNINGEIARYTALINPEIHINSAATAVNNITDFMVKNCPPMRDILPKFVDFIGSDSILVAHNAQFDLNFLNSELERNNFPCIKNLTIDTLQLSRWAYPQFERHKLQFLAEKLCIPVSEAHRAGDDAFVCMQLFLQIVKDKTHPEIAFRKLYDIVKTLRAEGGCPWDRNQTPLSIRRDLMEESFEAIDAITRDDVPHIREELGDVLLNAVMLSYMHEQSNQFTLEQVLNDICEKLIRRHPHVFANSSGKSEMKASPSDSMQVLAQWDKIKENVEGRKTNCTLDEVPEYFPPLLKAYKMLKKAGKKGFEWKCEEDVKAKVLEEWQEVEEAQKAFSAEEVQKSPFTVSDGNSELNEKQLHLEEEIGDLFLSLVNYARWLGVDPTIALDRANRKFYKRFSFVEKEMGNLKRPMSKENIHQMIELWKQSKEQK